MTDNSGVRQAAVERLHAQLEEPEAEAKEVQHRLDVLRGDCRAIEQRAMSAIQTGDDQRARDELVDLRARSEAAAPLEADLTVLRAMTGEYRRSLESLEADQNSPGAP